MVEHYRARCGTIDPIITAKYGGIDEIFYGSKNRK